MIQKPLLSLCYYLFFRVTKWILNILRGMYGMVYKRTGIIMKCSTHLFDLFCIVDHVNAMCISMEVFYQSL